jgi:ABC-type polysaccharide/polyol phosphate export permease
MAGASHTVGLHAGWEVQRRVVGALILREIHVRFGRRNLGYIWLFAELLMLGLTIAWIHHLAGAVSKSASVSVFAFFAVGYSLFFMFRSIVYVPLHRLCSAPSSRAPRAVSGRGGRCSTTA